MVQKKTFLTEVLFVNTFANITIIFLPTSEDQECNRSIALEKAERKQSLWFRILLKSFVSAFILTKHKRTKKDIKCREKCMQNSLHSVLITVTTFPLILFLQMDQNKQK